MQTLFITTVLSGTVSLVAAIVVARLHWRNDVTPFGRDTNAIRVLMRPASYVRGASVIRIRVLTATGGVLIAGAILCLVYQAFRDWRL